MNVFEQFFYCLFFNSNYIKFFLFKHFLLKIRCMKIYLFLSYISLTPSSYQIMKMDKISIKRKRVALTIENKLEVCKMVKNDVLKSFIMKQFSIGRSTLYDILKLEEKFKKFKVEKEELSFYLLLCYTTVILFFEKKYFWYLSGKILIRTCL